jgi:hypothetical protein
MMTENAFAELKSNQLMIASPQKSKLYRVDDIRYASSIKTAYFPAGLEIEFKDGKVVLLKFFNPEVRDTFAKSLAKFRRRKLALATSDWVARSMSTFEYLLEVNRAAGRSFCSSSQYPIFPWILMDFTSRTLDFQNAALYRTWSPDSVGSPGIVIDFLYGESRINSIFELWESIEFKELSPEFFYFPEVLFNAKSKLPTWARNSFDFVYQHRKALESEIASQHLNQWIDAVFGYRVKGKSVFERSHSTRAKKTAAEPRQFQLRMDEQPLVFAEIFNNNEKGFGLSLVEGTGHYSHKVVAFKEGESCQTVASLQIPAMQAEKSRIVGLKEKLFIMSSDTFLFDGAKLMKIPVTIAVSVDSDWVVIPGRDSNVSIYKVENLTTPFRRLFYYRERAICSCVSQKLHVFVIGTNQGGILIYPLERGNWTIAMGIEGTAVRKIWITPGWGLILVAHKKGMGGHMLSLFTLNGTYFKAVHVSEEIRVMYTWVADNGFDYIAIATRIGEILVTEAYELRFQKPLWNWKAPGSVITLSYNTKVKSLIGVCVDGTLFCEPCDPT